MDDYRTLAEKLRSDALAAEPEGRSQSRKAIQMDAFFQNLKGQIAAEMRKANAELRKQKLPTIERVFAPVFTGERLSLTFGTSLLCCVTLLETEEKITVQLFGPPHRCEISRMEFSLWPASWSNPEAPAGEHEKNAFGHDAGRIASEIVRGILAGRLS